MREEAPVCRVRLASGIYAWLVTRYDDVLAGFKDERLANDRRNVPTGNRPIKESVLFHMFGALNRSMLGSDPPDHARLRALVQKAFTGVRVEQMRSRIESLTHQLLDRAVASGHMDLVRDYALPLPTTIIAEMLGVPDSDREHFHRWSDAILTLNAMELIGVVRVAPVVVRFRRYIRKLVRLRRRQPQDDLVGALVAAEEAGDRLTEDELVGMIFLLLIAGHETTVNLIGNATLALLENPEELNKLRMQPAMMPSAVEELARYDSPLELPNVRWARAELDIAGTTIPAGDPVFLSLTSANRDPAQFPSPDTLDLMRTPNRHLAFGQGAHYCLGAILARMETQIALSTLLGRLPEFRLAVPRGELRWRRSFVLRGLRSLPLAFESAATMAAKQG